jgi:hypothetical protein
VRQPSGGCEPTAADIDDVLGDHPIEAGTNIAVLILSVHHNRRVWDNAHDFHPSEWSSILSRAVNLPSPEQAAEEIAEEFAARHPKRWVVTRDDCRFANSRSVGRCS